MGVGLVEPLIQFAVICIISSKYCASHLSQLSERVRYPWSTRYPIICVILAFLIFPVLGGLFNRVRGGWHPLGIITGDTVARLLMASGVAFYSRLGGISNSLLVFVIINTFLGLLIGWGCYFSMGRPLDSPVPMPEGTHTDCIDEPDRYGCFDLIIGVPQLEWTAARRWRRDMAGMSLRGILWMTPVGIGFNAGGYGNLMLRSGILMGPIYELGYDVPISTDNPNFGAGTASAEFYMGFFWWLVAAVSLLAKRQTLDQEEEVMSDIYIPLDACPIDSIEGLKKLEGGVKGSSTTSVSSHSERPGLSRNMALAQRFARITYILLDFVTWLWCLGTLALTIWCAVENHPLRPPEEA